MTRWALVVAVVAAAVVAPSAAADTIQVGILPPNAFAPPVVTVVAGDTVAWHNGTFTDHTVTGPDFDSGHIIPTGNFFHDFTVPGTFHYVCTIHFFMSGDVSVVPALLDAPSKPVARNAAVTLTGRAAPAAASVTVEADPGTGFQPVASAPVQAGRFRVVVRPTASAVYRAVVGADAGPGVPVQVIDRTVRLRAARHRLLVTADPPLPGAGVALQLRLRERFGWWTVARRRLDRRGRARFPMPAPRGVRARAALVGRDGWTRLSTSRPIRLRR